MRTTEEGQNEGRRDSHAFTLPLLVSHLLIQSKICRQQTYEQLSELFSRRGLRWLGDGRCAALLDDDTQTTSE
jgi:hypothetical protein